ncbi:MAG: hypothetical protein A2V85_02220 [Chloroflexi bacterium RBG_16_72_14]|nr:MAG: hypothetical protein A2V85_02220 [Chloroflexi bacterium RBG_16_72_14]
MRDALGLGCVLRSQPRVREGETVRASALPGARGRDAHEVDPHAQVPEEAVRETLQLLHRPRPVREGGPEEIGLAEHRGLVGVRADAQVPGPPRPPDAERKAPELVRGDHVDRGAQERGLDDRAALQRRREVVAAEAGHARPESYVTRGGVLRLEAPHLLHGRLDGGLGAVQQQLSREQGAVEVQEGERADRRRHRRQPASVACRSRIAGLPALRT